MSNQPPIETAELDEAIERVLSEMSKVECASKEYATMADQLTKLYKMKEIESNARAKELELEEKQKENEVNCRLREAETQLKRKQLDLLNRVSMDTWAVVGANLIGIVLILTHERVHIVTSKALSFVTRMR